MDATGTDRAVLVGVSAGVLWGMLLAAEHPERVAGPAFIAPGAPFGQHLARVKTPFDPPLRYHFEQNTHVRHRLDRYGAGRCMDFETATPETIAAEIGREVDYRPVETGGAALAAARIAELL